MAVASIHGRLAPLNAPNLRWYWFNAVVSAFGDSVTSIALTLMVLLETGSLSLMATMSIVVIVPGIVFGILSATWVDRWDARRVIIVSQALRAVVILGLVYVDLGHHLWVAFVLAACQSLIGTFDDPARARMIRTITDDETRLSVNSLTSSGVMVASVLGTTAGGGLVGALDVFWPAFVLNSLAFLAGAFAISRIQGSFAPVRASIESGGETSQFWESVLAGVRVIRCSPILLAVLLTASAANLGLGAATIMLTPLIVDVLHLRPTWFGPIEGAQSVAAVLVSLIIGVLGGTLDPKRLLVVCVVTTGVIVIGIGLAVGIWTLLGAMFLVGIAITPVGACFGTLLQTHAPGALIGRVAAAMNTCIQTCSVASMAIAGILGDAIGVRPVFWIAGSVCIIAGMLAGLLFKRSEGLPAREA
ncbi:MAG TPA: MFS transporter [Thermomicrobiales bacterium]|nr:MFS transporter [Thermomicrobiales bacterium]